MDVDVPVKKAAVAALTVWTPPSTGKAEMKPTTLLDVHEVECITRELERLLAAKEQMSGGDDGGRHQRQRANKVKPASKKGGFLAEFLGKHAVSICSGDAVNTTTARVVGRDRRRRGREDNSFREVEKV